MPKLSSMILINLKTKYRQKILDNMNTLEKIWNAPVFVRFGATGSALKNEIKFHSLSLKAVDTMIVEYEKMDIVGDEALIKTLKDFKVRVLDRYTSKDFRSSKSLRTGVSDEAHVIMTNLCNPAVIEALATQYRQRINL